MDKELEEEMKGANSQLKWNPLRRKAMNELDAVVVDPDSESWSQTSDNPLMHKSVENPILSEASESGESKAGSSHSWFFGSKTVLPENGKIAAAMKEAKKSSGEGESKGAEKASAPPPKPKVVETLVNKPQPLEGEQRAG